MEKKRKEILRQKLRNKTNSLRNNRMPKSIREENQINTLKNNPAFQNISSNDNKRIFVEEKIKLVQEHLIDLKKKSEKYAEEKKIAIKDLTAKLNKIIEEKKIVSDKIEALKIEAGDYSQVQIKMDKLKHLRAQLEVKNENLVK